MDLQELDINILPEPFGLMNPGAICHFNSLVQSLLSCSAILKTAMKNRKYLSKTNTGKAFYNLVYFAAPNSRRESSKPFKTLITRNIELLSSILLKELIMDLRKRRPEVRYGLSQESASEGLVLLIDMIDVPNYHKENPIARLIYHRYENSVTCKNCNEEVATNRDPSIVVNLFHYDEIMPTKPKEFSQAIWHHESKLEDYKCEKCNFKGDAKLDFYLTMVPDVLICSFNIYGMNRKKRYIPDRIFFHGKEDSYMIFKRVAMVEQFGGLHGGHYIAHCSREGGRIYSFDDTRVIESRVNTYENIYLVFYHFEKNVCISS